MTQVFWSHAKLTEIINTNFQYFNYEMNGENKFELHRFLILQHMQSQQT